MKLIYCPECHDVVKLGLEHTKCKCGASYGHYLADGLNAVINTTAIPLGIHNSQFVDALDNRPDSGMGERFEAFVIPVVCPTVRVLDYVRSKDKTGLCPKCGRYAYHWDGRAKGWMCYYPSCNHFVKE